ncbi:MAG TPA: hypothetical protein VGP72_28185 [Planctomycetota bacterium]|jgi:hypothetical protein
MSTDQLYETIKQLPARERLRLLARVAEELAAEGESENQKERPPKHSIMELHGLGAEIWQGVDAQEYVDELRKEWDHRP